MASLLDRLLQSISDRISAQLEPRIDAARGLAQEAVEDFDERVQLFRIELRSETSRLTRMAVFGLIGVICSIGAIIWLSAAAILLAWYTDFRVASIVAVVAVWVIAAAVSLSVTRNLALRAPQAFRLSRALLASDLEVSRQVLRERQR